MSLVKLFQNGNAVYINPDHIAIVSAHPTLVNQTNVTLATGLNVQTDGSASETSHNFRIPKIFGNLVRIMEFCGIMGLGGGSAA